MIKIAALTAEPYEDVADPQAVVRSFAGSRISADLFTFIQRPPDTTPKFNYAVEWDNMAVLEVTDYDIWWTKQVNDKTRNLVRKAEKKGVVVKQVPFDEALQQGIAEIYNETPVRQGRQFWHYGKDAGTVRRENEEYADRSEYFAAFHGDEIIGFMRLVHDEKLTNIMYILSKIAHREKAPNNALIAHAVKRGVRAAGYRLRQIRIWQEGRGQADRFQAAQRVPEDRYPAVLHPAHAEGTHGITVPPAPWRAVGHPAAALHASGGAAQQLVRIEGLLGPPTIPGTRKRTNPCRVSRAS
jgi:hypothetical protein